MPHFRMLSLRQIILAAALSTLFGSGFAAQESGRGWDVTKPRGQTREIDFTTSEGTWMSADISPDEQWVVFDLLGHIYRVPARGGPAECLTQDSGIAVNFHPRYSPDGKLIAFISDRKGQDNLWIMEADGSHPRPVFLDGDVRLFEPTWTPDGQYIIVRRHSMTERGLFEMSGLWMYHLDGSQGVQLVGQEVARLVGNPSVSSDGKAIYFHGCVYETALGCGDVIQGGYQLWRFERASGEIVEITTGHADRQERNSSGGAVAPEASPDGRWLAFARRIPDGTISFKGHRFGPRTALWLRNLQTGAERVLMDPIETDLAEREHGSRAVFSAPRILPGYSWARDSKSLIISQGGKIRRLWIETRKVETIPFTAHVHRSISEMASRSFRILDEPFTARLLRWHTASPDRSKLAFQAVGRIWIQDLPYGTPRRLTPDSFQQFEFSPAWSPDGKYIAFTSWDDEAQGHVWKISIDGGNPQQLTRQAGEYLNPIWSPDGTEIIVVRGSGATARGRSFGDNPWYELVHVPASGGLAEFIVRINRPLETQQIPQPSFGPDHRVYYPEQKRDRREVLASRKWEEVVETTLNSVKLDGSDKRNHMTFSHAVAAAPSPDATRVAFQDGDNIYVATLPLMSTVAERVVLDKKTRQFPVKQLSKEGGLSPRWHDATTVEFGSGNRYFAYHVDTGKTDTTEIRLLVPRSIPRGKLALQGARIITLENRRVIEKGTIVVKGGRIACVGNCNTDGVDKIIDAQGKTIIPGFVDMHAHHHEAYWGIIPRHGYENAVYLAYGVTTTFDPATWSQNVFSTAELIDAGSVIGPRTFSSGDILWSGDRAHSNELTSYEVAEENVKRLASWGAVTVKQYTQPRREQRQWIADVARQLGLRVTAEGNEHEFDLGMIMDGQTGFEHAVSYVPLYADVAKFFGQARIFYSPTFIVGGFGPWNEEYFFQESDVWKDQKQRRWLPWRQLIPHARRRILRPVTDYSFPLMAQGLADIIAEGGYGAIGSHGQQHGIGSHWETWMAASALGPMSALEVASLDGARFLGAENDIGSIAVGKLADLMVLNSNPLDNIRNTIDIHLVMKGGFLYEANSLDEIWPEHKAFGEYYWVNQEVLRDDDRPVDYWDRRR